MNWTEEKIKEVYEAAMSAAVTDEEFRAALLADPKAAIEKLTGMALPEGFKLKVLEEDPDYDMTILLPPMVGDELSAEEMEQVAGGYLLSRDEWEFAEKKWKGSSSSDDK